MLFNYYKKDWPLAWEESSQIKNMKKHKVLLKRINMAYGVKI
jgi:hypothetical protein